MKKKKKSSISNKKSAYSSIINLLSQFFVFFIIFISLLTVYFFFFIKDIKNLPGYIIKNPLIKRIIIRYGISDQRKELNRIFLKHKINSIDALLNDDDRAFSSGLLYAYIRQEGKMLRIYKPNSVKLSIRYPFMEKNKDGGTDLNIFSIQVKYDEELKNKIQNFADINLTDDLRKYFSLTASTYGDIGLRKNSIANFNHLPLLYVIGDSFTEGLYINDEDTFVSRMSVQMYKDGYAYPYNGGIEGYSLEEVVFNARIYFNILIPKAVMLVHSLGDIGATDEENEKLASNAMNESEQKALCRRILIRWT